MTVYFARAGGRIKIGWTKANEPSARLRQLSVNLGLKLEPIGHMKGKHDLERFFFENLKEHRTGGEWFHDHEEVRAFIQRALDGGAKAIGFRPKPKVETQAVQLSIRQTDEEYLIMFAKLVAMIWPHDGIRELVAFTEYDESEVIAWLNGEKMPPRLVRYAFASVMSQYAFGGVRMSFIEGRETMFAIATNPNRSVRER